MKTIVFFYHNFGGFWHLSRIYNISLQLLENFWEEYKIIILNSGEKQVLNNTDPKIKIFHLPTYDFEEYHIKESSSNSKIYALREWVYQKLLSDNNVDTFVVEHFPFGRNFLSSEIRGMIEYFKSTWDNKKVFSSLRDVIDMDDLDKNNLELFDRFLIHSDKNIINYDDIFPWDYKHKVFYTGVVVPKIEESIEQTKDDYIVVSIWWWQDGFSFITDFLLKLKDTTFVWKVYMSLWSSYSWANKADIKDIYKWECIIQDTFDDFIELKKHAKLVVSMGGYNNMYENISLGAISVIYTRESHDEQYNRFELLWKRIENLYDGKQLNSKDLEWLLKSHTREVPDIDFGWAYASASFIALFGKHKYIKIRPLNACNAECDMCWVIRRPLEKNNIELLEQTIHDFYLIGWEVLNFTWGEPTIYKWFYDLLDLAKSYGLVTSVSSNWSTFGKKFYHNITHKWVLSIDYMDISVDAIWYQHDTIRAMPGLFHIIQKNIPILRKLWIILHINVTIRRDNIEDLIRIYDFFACMKIDSISFSMIDSSPFHDVTELYPSKVQLENFYNTTVPCLQSRNWIRKISISPLNKTTDLDTFIKWILGKHNYPRISGEKCPFISSMSEIRINENGALSPCCEMDDYDEDIGNINNTSLIETLTSPQYYTFINQTYPNISKACSSCKIVVPN